MHALLTTAAPVLDVFSILMLLVTMPRPVKLVLVTLRKDVSTRMIQPVAMEIVNATIIHAIPRLVASPSPLSAMTTMSAPPTRVMMIQGVFTLQFSVVSLMSAINMAVIQRLVVLKYPSTVMTMTSALLMTVIVILDVPMSH